MRTPSGQPAWIEIDEPGIELVRRPPIGVVDGKVDQHDVGRLHQYGLELSEAS